MRLRRRAARLSASPHFLLMQADINKKRVGRRTSDRSYSKRPFPICTLLANSRQEKNGWRPKHMERVPPTRSTPGARAAAGRTQGPHRVEKGSGGSAPALWVQRELPRGTGGQGRPPFFETAMRQRGRATSEGPSSLSHSSQAGCAVSSTYGYRLFPEGNGAGKTRRQESP